MDRALPPMDFLEGHVGEGVFQENAEVGMVEGLALDKIAAGRIRIQPCQDGLRIQGLGRGNHFGHRLPDFGFCDGFPAPGRGFGQEKAKRSEQAGHWDGCG